MDKELRSDVEQFAERLANDRLTEIDLDELRWCLRRVLDSTMKEDASSDDTDLLRDDIVDEITRLVRGSEMLQYSTESTDIDDLIRHLKRATSAELLRFRENARRNFARLCRRGRRPFRTMSDHGDLCITGIDR